MPSTPPRVVPWTPEEDKRLIPAVASCGSKICWKQVAASMPGRNNKSCRKRWLHSLDPKLRKGRWTSEEDIILLESIERYGKRWYEVARALPGRTDDQCAKRFKEAVDPSIRKGPWTREEDEQLWNAFKIHGNKWHTIAGSLQGRPPIHCRNRLQSLQRTRAAAEEDVASPPNGLHNLPSPLLSSSAPSPPSFSSPLTPSLLLPLDEPIQGNPSAAPVYDGEPDCQLFQAIPPQVSQEETFRISPQALQHGPYITVPTPTNDTARCWQESIPLSGLWKERPAQSPMSGESIQFYLPLQTSSTGQMDSTSLSNNSVSHPPTLFTMTCPVPHCCYQCQTVAEIWRHITWTHVRPQPDSGIEGIVERVVLGNA